MEEKVIFDSVKVQEILPHRYPFLMIDKVVEMTLGERIVAIKAVSVNEPFFVGHFPGRPIMPGVLVLEAMAQAAAILAKMSPQVGPDTMLFFAAANNVKWKRQVVPGDLLRIEMSNVRNRRTLWMMEGKVFVDGNLVACGEVTAAVVDNTPK